MSMRFLAKLEAAGKEGLMMGDLNHDEQVYMRELAHVGPDVGLEDVFRHELFKSVKVGERVVAEEGALQRLRIAYDQAIDQLRDRLPPILDDLLRPGVDHVIKGWVVGSCQGRGLYVTEEWLDDVVKRTPLVLGKKRIGVFVVIDSLAPGPPDYVFKRETPQTAH